MVSVLLALALTMGFDTAPEVVAPGRAGMALCARPNDANKTCRSITYYRPQADGTFLAESTGWMGPDESIQISAPARLKDNSICLRLSAERVTAAKLFRSGKPMPQADADTARANLAKQLSPLFGAEMCQILTPTANGLFSVIATFDGRAQTPSDSTRAAPIMRWVSPADGYSLER